MLTRRGNSHHDGVRRGGTAHPEAAGLRAARCPPHRARRTQRPAPPPCSPLPAPLLTGLLEPFARRAGRSRWRFPWAIRSRASSAWSSPCGLSPTRRRCSAAPPARRCRWTIGGGGGLDTAPGSDARSGPRSRTCWPPSGTRRSPRGTSAKAVLKAVMPDVGAIVTEQPVEVTYSQVGAMKRDAIAVGPRC